MIIGFTGTRKGMSQEQIKTVINLLISLNSEEVHHGDCVGADADFHSISQKFNVDIVGHPASGVGNQRAFCEGFSHPCEEKPPLERNRDIIDDSDILIATPKVFSEERRGGTWATIRYAISSGKKVYIVYPDGRIEEK